MTKLEDYTTDVLCTRLERDALYAGVNGKVIGFKKIITVHNNKEIFCYKVKYKRETVFIPKDDRVAIYFSSNEILNPEMSDYLCTIPTLRRSDIREEK